MKYQIGMIYGKGAEAENPNSKYPGRLILRTEEANPRLLLPKLRVFSLLNLKKLRHFPSWAKPFVSGSYRVVN